MDKKLRFKQQTPGFHQQNITGMTWMAVPLAVIQAVQTGHLDFARKMGVAPQGALGKTRGLSVPSFKGSYRMEVMSDSENLMTMIIANMD